MPSIVPRDAMSSPNAGATSTLSPVARAIAAMNKPREQQAAPVEPVVDAAAPATQSAEVVPPKEEEALSPKLVELARREKMFLKKQAELKAREDALAAKESEYKTSYVDKKTLTANPVQALLDAGLTHDQIVQQLLNGQQQVDPVLSSVQAEIKALKDAQEQSKVQAAEAQKKNYDNAVNQIRTDVKALVDSNPDYESIKVLEAQEAVVDLIKKQFETDGTLLSVEDASAQVEAYILEEALKMAGLNKVKAKLNPVAVEASTEEPVEKKQQVTLRQAPQPLKTLTNAATTVTSKPINEKDRRARAIALLEGRLQK